MTFAQTVLAVHDHLIGAGVEHAFGGALALAYYAEPRATADVDVNVFAPTGTLEAARLRAQATIVEADARTQAAKMEAQLLRDYPELLQMRLATLQFQAIGRANLNIVSPSLAQTPFALGAQGLWQLSAAAQQQLSQNDAKLATTLAANNNSASNSNSPTIQN